MSSAQDRWVLGAAVLSESAWLFPLVGVLGVWMGRGGSPLSWPAVLTVITVSLVLGRRLPAKFSLLWLGYVTRALFGATAIYLAVGTQVAPGLLGLDLGWLAGLASETASDDFRFKAIMGSAFGVLLWWRGGRLAAADPPIESLTFGFRVGVLALAFATVVDLASSADLHIAPMIVIFFASGLAGLSMGNLLPQSTQLARNRSWSVVTAGVVGAMLALGLVVGLLFGVVQRVLQPFASGAADLLAGALGLVILPILFAAGFFVEALFWLVNLFPEAEPEEVPTPVPLPAGTNPAELATGIQSEGQNAFLLEIIEWAILGLLAIAALYLLTKAYRRWSPARSKREGVVERESVAEGADLLEDIGKLLEKLKPGWLRVGARARFHLPDGPAEVVDVLRIYYELLDRAERLGVTRPPHETTREFRTTLEELFPGNLARMATEAFDRACYGHFPAHPTLIDQMRSELKALPSGGT